jgi:hypothetical protein
MEIFIWIGHFSVRDSFLDSGVPADVSLAPADNTDTMKGENFQNHQLSF